MAYAKHTEDARALSASCAVITLSDTRTQATDTSGQAIVRALTADGHHVVSTHLIPDDPIQLIGLFSELLVGPEIDVLLTNGGTGISQRDTTVGAIEKVIDTPLPGFGELFRMLSWEQIGSGAMLSRALAGITRMDASNRGKLIFAMPGSTKAVELAMTRLILPELRHLLAELSK